MSEANIDEESNVVEKNVPVFIETDGVTVQVGWASEVQETGGRVIEKFSAFKRVFLVNPIFGDGEGEIQAPIESHVDPEEDGLTDNEKSDADVLGMPSEFFRGDEEDAFEIADNAADSEEESQKNVEALSVPATAEDEEAEFERQLAEEQAQTEAGQNAAPVAADPDGDTAVGKAAPAPLRGNKPNPFTRTN